MLFKNVNVDGLNIFYREAGNETAPKLVLLHGFPSSSSQFRDLIPRRPNCAISTAAILCSTSTPT